MNATTNNSLLTIVAFYINKFARDLYSPALPAMALYYHTTNKTMQFSIAVFFTALFFSRFFWPILADHYSARKVILFNIGTFILGTCLAMVSETSTAFIITRFLQGFTVGAIPVMSRVIVFAEHGSKVSVKIFSYTSIVTAWAPGISSLMGGYLYTHYSWQVLHLTLIVCAIISLILMLRGVSPTVPTKKSSSLFSMYQLAFETCRSSIFWEYGIPFALHSGAVAAFVTLSPFLFINHFHFTPIEFGYINLIVFTGMLIGKLACGWFITDDNEQTLLRIGLFICSLASLILFVFILLGITSIHLIIIAITCYMAGYGVIMPISKTFVMETKAMALYSASAMLSVSSGLAESGASIVVAQFELTQVLSLALILLIVSSISHIIAYTFAPTGSC